MAAEKAARIPDIASAPEAPSNTCGDCPFGVGHTRPGSLSGLIVCKRYPGEGRQAGFAQQPKLHDGNDWCGEHPQRLRAAHARD